MQEEIINIPADETPRGGILGRLAAAAGADSAQLHMLRNEANGEVVHSFATMSFPLRKDHWIYQRDKLADGGTYNVPPMPFRMGSAGAVYLAIDPEDLGALIKSGQQRLAAVKLDRKQFAHAIRAAGKYAVRCATMNGSEMDFDPDALLQNLVVGFLGYWTKDGLTGDPEDAAWCDPQQPFDFTAPPTRNSPGQSPQGCTAEPQAQWCPTCTPEGDCPVHAGKPGVPASNPTPAPADPSNAP